MSSGPHGRCFRAAEGPLTLEKHQIFFLASWISWELLFTSEYAFWRWSLTSNLASFLSYLSKLPALNTICWLTAVILIHISQTVQTQNSKYGMLWLHLKSKTYLIRALSGWYVGESVLKRMCWILSNELCMCWSLSWQMCTHFQQWDWNAEWVCV